MAEESENGQEKTEEPTPKRQRESREKGQVPRSRELATMLVMLAAAGALPALGEYMASSLGGVLEQNFRLDRATVFDPQAPVNAVRAAITDGVLTVLPLGLILFFVAIVGNVALGGWSFSGKAMQPKFEKISPLKGFKRMFGVRGPVELGKALGKVIVIGVAGVALLRMQQEEFRVLAGEALEPAVRHAAWLFFGTFTAVSASLILIALVDIPYQLWDHTQKIRMTRQEVKDEMKDTEGKPEVKQKVRQLQQEMAQRRMMEKVPAADVVVTNPTHFAVALRYDPVKMGAPKVVAMGADLVAQRIRERAAEHRVPVFEAPPLARALYFTTELDREIPSGLYLAVAQVLAYVYQLRNAAGRRPRRPRPDIPDEFLAYARAQGPQGDTP